MVPYSVLSGARQCFRPKELCHDISSHFFALYKETFKLKETTKYQFDKMKKHQRSMNQNRTRMAKDGED